MKNLNKLYENRDKPLNKNLLIVDLNNIIHKSVHVHPNLHANYKGNNIYTGGLYGFIQQLDSAIEKFKIDDVIICTDQPPYMRSMILKEYKLNRKFHHPEFKKKLTDTRNLIYEFASRANITVWSKLGFEADDLIYMTCSHFSNDYYKVIILSNDKDLYQVFEIRGNIYLSTGGILYGNENFYNEYEISVLKWAWVAALSGGHNGIPGFDGIGEKKALKLVKEINNNNIKLILESLYPFNEIPFDKANLYYHLAKLPFFFEMIQSKSDFPKPKIKQITEESEKKANLFLKRLSFNIAGMTP